MSLTCPQIQSQRMLFKFFLGGMLPDPLALFTQLLTFMTTHHLKVSMHTTLQLVGLITEKLIPMALNYHIDVINV